jgi:dihydrolipoamide dehydrogenase
MKRPKHELVVIGGGPGGYVAAIRAAQLGLDVACIDENGRLGGTCLRIGCIPSKALLESTARLAEARHSFEEHGIRMEGLEIDLAAMIHRKDTIVETLTRGIDGLLKRNKITRYLGHGRVDGVQTVVVDGEDGAVSLDAQRVVVATGSKPATLAGVEPDGDRIGTSTEALSYQEAPEHLVVIGAGYIGLEMGSVWNRVGSKITVLEAADRILPGTDLEMANEAQKVLQEQGLEFRLGAHVQRAFVDHGQCVVECEGMEPIRCDRVLLAVGRVPNTAGLGLESVGVQPEANGEIPVDDGFATSAKGLYAIGDCIRGPKLAHKASEEGIACVERMVTGYGRVNYDTIPSVVYTHPEIASVGRSEEQLRDTGHDYRKSTFPFRANGRARTLGEMEGGVKILADGKTDRALGVHILGPRAGDLIAEAAVAMEFGASSEDLARCCHAHPTLAEAVREAALGIGNRAIHT